jgi:hypothetical protein
MVPAPRQASRRDESLHERHSQANPPPGKTGRETRAIPPANRKQRREVRLYLNGKIEYDAMTGQTETDRGRQPFGLVEPLQQGFAGQPLELRFTELLCLVDHLRQGRDAQIR